MANAPIEYIETLSLRSNESIVLFKEFPGLLAEVHPIYALKSIALPQFPDTTSSCSSEIVCCRLHHRWSWVHLDLELELIVAYHISELERRQNWNSYAHWTFMGLIPEQLLSKFKDNADSIICTLS